MTLVFWVLRRAEVSDSLVWKGFGPGTGLGLAAWSVPGSFVGFGSARMSLRLEMAVPSAIQND